MSTPHSVLSLNANTARLWHVILSQLTGVKYYYKVSINLFLIITVHDRTRPEKLLHTYFPDSDAAPKR